MAPIVCSGSLGLYANPNPPAVYIATTSPLTNAVISTPYSFQFSASAGTPPFTWTLISAPGLNTWALSSTGVLTGTPGNIETDNITVRVTDKNNKTATGTFSLTIAASAPVGGPLVFQQVYDMGFATSNIVTAATYSGNVATLTFTIPSFGAITPVIGMTISVQGIGVASQYNGSFVVTGGTSTTVSYTLASTPVGTPTFTNAYVTIIQSYALTDAAGNYPSVNAAFNAPIQVQGGTPPYTFSFYQAAQATVVGATGYSGTLGNNWSINSTTGAVTGTPQISEADIIYVKVQDSVGNSIQSPFQVGVISANLGTGYYSLLSGTALRNAIFANAPGGTLPIPSWITSAPAGYTITYPKTPNTVTAGQQTVVPITSYATVIPIPGGTSQFTCATSNARYVLQGNLSCPAICILLESGIKNVLIDLNGYTLTYATATVTPVNLNSIDAAGIGFTNNYNAAGTIEIINGRIQSGAGRVNNSVQGEYGYSVCPIKMNFVGATTLYVRGCYLQWNNYSASAVSIAQCSITNSSIFENNTFEDCGWTVKNRLAQINVITGIGDVIYTVRNNKFLGIRYGVIGPSILIYNNEIWNDGWFTNSSSISVQYNSANGVPTGMQIYNNNIYMTGSHPQSFFVGVQNTASTQCNIYNNWVEGMYTRASNLVPSPTNGLDDYENYADGITMKFGNPAYNNIYNNMMWTHAKLQTVWNPKTNSYQNSTARGVYYEGAQNINIQNNAYNANLIAATSADGTANCWVLGAGGNGNGWTLTGNRLITNRVHFWFADSYDYSTGLTNNPTLTGNYIELPTVGSGLNYATFRNDSELVFGSIALSGATVSGSTVTLTWPPSGSTLTPGIGAPIIVSGVTGGTGINGTFPGSAVIYISPSQLQYTATATGPGTGGTLDSYVVVGATLQSNIWVNGTWAGSATPANYTILGAAGGASGTTPVSYSYLGPNMSYTLINEPGNIL